MSNIDIVKQAFTLIESGKIQEAKQYFSDDFTFKGPSFMPLSKGQYLTAHEALVNALPDWKFNMTDWQEKGDQVTMKAHITGTHTSSLRFPFPGLKHQSPTNKSVSLPEEPTTVTVKNGKITAIEAPNVSGGGILGLLEQLGIQPPVPAGV